MILITFLFILRNSVQKKNHYELRMFLRNLESMDRNENEQEQLLNVCESYSKNNKIKDCSKNLEMFHLAQQVLEDRCKKNKIITAKNVSLNGLFSRCVASIFYDQYSKYLFNPTLIYYGYMMSYIKFIQLYKNFYKRNDRVDKKELIFIRRYIPEFFDYEFEYFKNDDNENYRFANFRRELFMFNLKFKSIINLKASWDANLCIFNDKKRFSAQDSVDFFNFLLEKIFISTDYCYLQALNPEIDIVRFLIKENIFGLNILRNIYFFYMFVLTKTKIILFLLFGYESDFYQ